MSCTKDVGKLVSRPPIYKWLLDDSCVRGCKSPDDSIESPLISTSTDDTRRLWRLRFYPRGRSSSKDKNAADKYVPLQLVSYNRGKVEVSFDLATLQDDVVVQLYESDRDSFQQIMWERGERFLSKRRVMKGDTGLLKNGNLTVLCRIVPPFSEIVGKLDAELKNDGRASELASECSSDKVDCFARLVRDDNFGDATIKCAGGEALRAHSAILESHSEAFTKMLRDKSKSRRHGVTLKLDDVDAAVLVEILRFAYMGKVDWESKGVDGETIFSAADRLEMKRLKSACQKTMMNEQLTCKNAVERLKFAERYKLADMKQQVIAFIALNSKKMYRDPSFVMLKELNAELVYELVEAIARSKIES